MGRVVGAIVVLWCSVAWIPFPAGFVLVRVLDPRQGDRMAFASGLTIAAVASLPILLLWLAALLFAAFSMRRLPGFAATIGLLFATGLVGVLVSGAIGGALGPFGALVAVPAAGALILLAVAVLIAYPVVRSVFGVSVSRPAAP